MANEYGNGWEVMGENGALGWDDAIQEDGDEYTLLRPGNYEFEVVDFERAYHGGSAKLPPCNKAVMTLRVFGDGQQAYIKYNLFLHKKTEGMISQFFRGIGMKGKGEQVRMDFAGAIGKHGMCKVKHREYDGNTYNEIARIMLPNEKQSSPKTTAAPGGFVPGEF